MNCIRDAKTTRTDDNTIRHSCRAPIQHQTLRVTPAMEAGLTDTLYDMGWIVHLIEAITVPPKTPGPTKGTKYRPRKPKT